jgi:thiamine-phosphate pyrophosphorylase
MLLSSAPILYLITSGNLTAATRPADLPFAQVLQLVRRAVDAGVSLIQLREKQLSAVVLYEMAKEAAAITHASQTRLLINDRADIARAAGADGVHLTAQSLEAAVVRRAFGPDFLIGVSSHSMAEARAARDGSADFAVFGPVFDTPSKRAYGEPVGLPRLAAAANELAPFPLIAIGGVAPDNISRCRASGAAGIAGISLFNDQPDLAEVVSAIRTTWRQT